MRYSCPISHITVDENRVRLNGLYSLILLVFGYFNLLILLFLALDYYIRAFTRRHSPISDLSHWTTTSLKIPVKPIDGAPKKFAAKIGFFMSASLFIVLFLELYLPAFIIFVSFALAISLETFLNFCVGCQIYSFFTSLNLIKS